MSAQFEHRLADWLSDHLEENPPQGGQKLLAEFHNPETADTFATSLVTLANEAARPIPGTDTALPALTATSGAPLFIARVEEDVDASAPDYVITQGFATKMRNLVSDSVHDAEPFAFLMVLESDATLDTLEASENLFGEDGSLNLKSFRETLLDPTECENKQGRALLRALNDVLEADSLYVEDVEVLDTLCEIRAAIEDENADALPELIGTLPQFIREDYITQDWFEKDTAEDDLTESATEFLTDNQSHANQLRRAHRTGTDTQSKLSATYEEEFVTSVTDSASWKSINHTSAEKHEIERTSRQFRDLEVSAQAFRPYSASNEDITRRAVLAIPNDGEVRLTAEFTADLDDVPHEYVDSNGKQPENARVSKRENRLTAVLENVSTEEPTFGRLLLYVGKKTTGGSPTHEFDLAVLPRWFFDATADITLDVDVPGEALIHHGDDEITLTPPERLDFDFSTEQDVVDVGTTEDQVVPFTSYLVLNPTAPETVERVSCLVAPEDGIPIRIAFLTEVTTAETEELVFPLMLAALAEPDRWGADELQLPPSLSIDTDRGQIHSGAIDGIRIEESMLELIQIEEQLLSDRTAQHRVVDSEELRAGEPAPGYELDHHPELQSAYERLFEHFDERNRTPSTDAWDTDTQRLVEEVLEAYQASVDAIGEQPDFTEHEPLRGVGTIRSTVTDKTWLSPFHPVMLAYAYRIATWRDSTLVAADATAGFRTDRFLDRFNPSGLLPYIVSEDDTNQLLRGLIYEENPLWNVYSPIESPGSVTPQYMERVIRDKLDTFMHSFPLLFKLHEGRPFVINLINMGDLRPVIKGLYEFYKRIEKSQFSPPQILLRIYGGPAEGESLDQFFGDNAQSRLRTQLEQKNDEIVDLLRSNLMYVRCGEYRKSSHEPAHLTFFRGLLTEDSGITELGDLPSGMLLDGLLPREAIDVQTGSSGTVYSVGFGHDTTDTETLVEGVATTANTLEAGRSNNKYLADHTLKKTVKSSHKTDLQTLWDDSLWVCHVQPNVGLEFYIESENEIGSDEGMVMIHYNDQYDSSSPNYDVITSTTKRDPYLTALKRALKEGHLGEYLDPEHILSRLIAIDGELALELQRADDKGIVEKAGFIGGLALSQALLEEHTSGYTWVPLSLNELSRHDRATRSGTAGLLQYASGGAASDDICMVGVPDDLSAAPIQLWLVETKGGSSQLKKGREQIKGAIDNLQEIFHPDINYSDAQLLYAEFGKTLIDVAKRMASYGVLSENALNTITQNDTQLNEGAFSIEFLTDSNGHIGEVIRVRSNTLKTTVDLSHEVRTIDTSLDTLRLLDDTPLSDALSDLQPENLTFDITPTKPPTTAPPSDTPTQPEPTPTDHHTTSTPTETTEPTTTPEETPTPTDEPSDTVKQPATPEPAAKEASTPTDQPSEPAKTQPEAHDETQTATDEPKTSPSEESTEQTAEEPSGPQTEPTDTDTDTPPESAGASSPEESEPSAADEPTTSTGNSPDQELPAGQLLSKLTKSEKPAAKIDRGKLVNDLKREFESLGVRIHPPNPASISVGPRKIGVDVHPKEGQTVEGILKQLNSLSVHIQAEGDIVGTPNPSKGAVRLEIPHGEPTTIHLRDGLEALQDDLQNPVSVPLGVDVEMEHHALSMLEEKHALIGGATGSGKSNFLSTLVASFAITTTPEEVKLSILDPKGVDFGRFENLPHVQAGTYLDSPEACTSYLIELLENELQTRKQRLQDSGFPSVNEFNDYADEMGHDPMPYHVIIIDEFADLIMSLSDNKDEFEDAVTRLAQVGRAHGYVIFLATQRPSADIVSGKIKANFPCRISFRLPSNTDSRVILDEPGAEDLGGAGDMIAITQEGTLRLQGYRLSPGDAIEIRNTFEPPEN